MSVLKVKVISLPYIFQVLCFTNIKISDERLHRVRTDLEKSLNLTLVLENSLNFKIVPFVLELSWNFVKLPLKM